MDHWTKLEIQQGLLQSYRGHFLTAQSIITAIGSTMVTKEQPMIMFWLFFGLGVVMLVLGGIVENKAAKGVDDLHDILKFEKTKMKWLQSLFRTRHIFQYFLPALFGVCWTFLAIIALYFHSLPCGSIK